MSTTLTHHCSVCGAEYPDGNNTCHPTAIVETVVSRLGGSRPGAGRKSGAGQPRTHRMEFRLAEHEFAEVQASVPDGQMSDLVRTLLLEHVRR